MRLRRVSWLVGAASVIVPVGYWHWQMRAFEAWEAQRGGPACGMPVLGIVGVALLLAIACSLVAVTLGAWAYHRQPGPRTARRSGEVLLLAAPLLVAGALIVLAMWF